MVQYMNKTSINTQDPGWRFRTHERTISEVFARYKLNEPFIINITNMFSYLGNACKLIWNREKVLHILFNYYLQEEVHYRNIPDIFQEVTQNEFPNDEDLYLHIKLNKESFKNLVNLVANSDIKSLKENNQIQRIRILNKNEKEKLLDNEFIISMIQDKSLFNKSEPIVLIFEITEGKLGCFLLYGELKKDQRSTPFSKDPSSESALISWANKITNLLIDQADVKPETYLPSYRKRQHSTKAVILIGDITNFTQLSTMLRIIETSKDAIEYSKATREIKVKELGKIMQEHCSDMSQIISQHNGRIERFVGDGLMAIFGEHGENPIIALGHAFAAATKMVEKFCTERKPAIQQIIYGKEGHHEINEMIEIDYGIGINYGTVLFDYLGDDRHREYSCIGDHVAFADRLMHKAARFDVDTNEKWKPILFSQTVEQHFRYWVDKKDWDNESNLKNNHMSKETAKRILHAKGYGYPSYVFGIEPDLFNYRKYEIYTKELGTKTEEQVIEQIKYENNWTK